MTANQDDVQPVNGDGVVSPEARSVIMCGASLVLAGANVIMQLSRLPIGRGVAESVVESGSLSRHPIKRARTTIGYIVIVLLGSDHERSVLRREVNHQHQLVRSRADSPIQYNAFDPELQLWVAACMYRGLHDAVTVLHATLPEHTLDELYQHSSRFATSLQVPRSMWPADRKAFETYWNAALPLIAVDDVTRDYLRGVASLRFLPSVPRVIGGPPHRFITTGFLSEPFREELGLAWSAQRQVGFRIFTTLLAHVSRHLPRPLREFPMNVVLWDASRRIRTGRPLM